MSSTSPVAFDIAIIGLGAMGCSMAKRLIEKGFRLGGFDPDPKACAQGRAIGVGACDSAADLARHSHALLVMVDHSDQLVEVAAEIAPAQLVIASSTVTADAVNAASALITAVGAQYVDAPVSGGVAEARCGHLSIAAGCSAGAYQAAQPYLDALCGFHCHIGPIGAGFAAKMVRNLIFHITSVAVAETMILATHAGADPERLLQGLQGGAGRSKALTARAKRYLSRDFNGVPLRIAHREILMERDLAHRHGHRAPLGEITKALHDLAMAEGLAEAEGAALMQIYERQAGLTLATQIAGGLA